MSDLPPGPRNVLLSTLRYLRDPYGSLLESAARHGDPFSWPSVFGPMVITGDPEAVARLPYLEAVCLETLRLNPAAPLIGRTLGKALTLQGHALPAGVSVGIGIVNVHRRPDLYPEPERFRPQRFLERQYGPFEYLPFGGGARRCLGAAFALYEMKLVLATVMRQARGLRLVRKQPVRAALRNTTVGPAGGIPMRLA